MAKEKMSLEKKVKLIYSGELIFFSLVFIVIATLEICGVIGNREIVLIIFNWVTIFGGTWMIADFIWLLCSQKRRKKNAIIDKALLVPAGLYLITFDIICFTGASFVTLPFRRLMMAIVFYYFAVAYIFQGVYHWFKPIPGLLEDVKKEQEEAEREKREKELEEAKEKEGEPLENLAEEVKEENKPE